MASEAKEDPPPSEYCAFDRIDPEAVRFLGPGRGGPSMKHVFRRDTYSLETGRLLASEPKPKADNDAQFLRPLPKNVVGTMTIFYYTPDADVSKPSFHKVKDVDKAKDTEVCTEDYWEHRPDQKAWLYHAVTFRTRLVKPTDVPGGPKVEDLQRGGVPV